MNHVPNPDAIDLPLRSPATGDGPLAASAVQRLGFLPQTIDPSVDLPADPATPWWHGLALMKPAEAAMYLRTTAGQLANLRSEGRGPAYLKVGGRVLYAVADLDAWLATFRVVPAFSTAA